VGADTPRVSIRELAELIANRVGNVEVIVEGKTSAGPRSRYIPNMDKFKQLYVPRVSLDEGLRRTLTHYQYSSFDAS
jgi:nucleoside-diphosphate-sugar epimerase